MIAHLPPKPAHVRPLRQVSHTTRSRVAVAAGVTTEPIPKPGKGCRVTYSRVSPAARAMGFRFMVTYWCPE